MRLSLLLSVTLLAIPTLTYADTVLVGTNLSATNPSAQVLCPIPAGCDDAASQFTLSTAVAVDSISVVVSAPVLNFQSASNFTIGLGNVLGPGVTTGVGAGSLVIDPMGDFVTQEFTFSGLDIPLAPGTYYLGMAGGNVIWDYASPLLTTAGALGLQLECDPTTPLCTQGISKWDVNHEYICIPN